MTLEGLPALIFRDSSFLVRHSGTMTFFGEEVGEESDILIIILFKCSLHEVDLVVTLSFPIKVSKNPRI